jgi:spermidine synthase
MLPPTLCFGALFACFIHILGHAGAVGEEIGEAYFANTLGTIAGSVVTGFCFIPLIGLQKTLFLAAAINAGLGILINS